MRWVNMQMEAGFSWPDRLVEFPFEGKRVVLQPRTETLARTASLYDQSDTSFEDGGSALSRFLSCLAWSRDESLEDLWAMGSNDPSTPGRIGHGGRQTSNWAAVEPWHIVYLPKVSDPKAALALALYREGMGLRFAPLAFLSFFKVLNILHDKGAPQKAWINSVLNRVVYDPAAARLAEVRASHSDVGSYLWEQGRCAVAHANSASVNPDDYADKRRLWEDLRLMKELAALFIEAELKVEREGTFLARIRDSRDDQPQLFVQNGVENGRVVYAPARRSMGTR